MSSGMRILVYGATSTICHELLKIYAGQGARFYLAGRSAEKLLAVGDDLSARGGVIEGTAAYDFNDWQQHDASLSRAVGALGELDLVVVAHGTLPEQSECESSSAAVKACIDDNFASTAVIAHSCAGQLERQGRGALAVISSVAGDRGRKGNYTYGAAKAGVDAMLQGLQGRFSGTAVKVINIKPGMIITAMTSQMEHGFLWATAEDIAPSIYRAISRGRRVCYVPGYWRAIMLVVRLLPTTVLARLPI